VVLIQPTGKDLQVMGPNLMSRGRRHLVIETAIETVSRQLAEPGVRELLRDLPRAARPERVRRPKGPPATWPPLPVVERRLRRAS
jgi:hypothetical protein